MNNDTNSIDVAKLRSDMVDECMGAAFGGGFGGAFLEASDINNGTEEQIIEIAKRKGIDFDKYQL